MLGGFCIRHLVEQLQKTITSRAAGPSLEKFLGSFDGTDFLRDRRCDPLIERHAVFPRKAGSSRLD
ncbi:hypothetical protein GR197_22825 [Rhizobium phaseoli]|jgi:hypothetical protein|uniref:Uncharacterized protein n=1 Tax=Rhizobium phaseoli TaxID=396 RepID=A0A7K3UI11_9HYPH|nr:hypothetical protein [Rhizobium phaseoli]NEJ73343.1 hypothetical protein [Rhizobium phaseoli]